ncbi:MAG: Wzz/FepE/Etk N-terminal domain-containing protein [Ignavibacteriaceae bacterium]|nr:Wzz/FepE/Etk N-terminal domain-containing protein [Ignavibacteriaceae bacterium]
MGNTDIEISGNSKQNKNRFEDFLIILVKYRRSIIINVFIVTLAAIIISILIHNKYTAVTSFISPKQKGGLFGQLSSGFSSTIQNLSKTLGGRVGSISDEAYNYLAILKSRSAAESVINKFNLRDVYGIDKTKPYEDVISELENNVDFHIQDEGNITVSVTDKSPERAAEMANYYVQILNEISTNLGVAEAHNNREFIEGRFLQIKADVVSIEDSLEYFNKKYHVLDMKEQMKAEITAAAELKTQVEEAKIQSGLLKNS